MHDMNTQGNIGPQGKLSVAVLPAMPDMSKPLSRQQIAALTKPRRGLSEYVNDWRSDNRKRDAFKSGVKDAVRARRFGEMFGLAHIEGSLFMRLIRADGSVEDFGLVGLNIVTTAGVNYIGNAFRGTTEPENQKFHGIGTSATAEVVGDTALGTELTTEYNPNSTRATGTLAGSNNVFTTVGTNTVDAAPGAALREWGLFDNATVGSGTLLDRVTYAAVTLANGDSLQTTFNLTFPSGG